MKRRTLTLSPGTALWPGPGPLTRFAFLGAVIAISGFAVPIASSALTDRSTTSADGDQRSSEWVFPSDAPFTPGPTAEPVVPTTQPSASVQPTKPPNPTRVREPEVTATTSPKIRKTSEAPAAPSTTVPKKAEPAEPAKPAPTFSARQIDAASAQNVREGVPSIDCPTCASGTRIQHLAGTSSLTVPVNGVKIAGNRRLTVVYESGDGARDLYVTVNGGAPRKITVPGTPGWESPGSVELTIRLKKGDNTIRFDNPVGPAPDLDQFRIS